MPARTLPACPLVSVVKVLILVLFAIAPVWAETLTVGPGGENQFPTLTTALQSALSGDKILLASGTYGAASGESFPIPIQVPVEIRRAGPSVHPVLQGDGTSNLLILREVEGVLIDGLTFRGGSSDSGGGLLVRDASPEIVNCVFEENEARLGGALYLENSYSIVENCTFALNTSLGDDFFVGGGAVYCILGAPTFVNCLFLRNRGQNLSGGGGLLMDTAGTVIDCRFLGNTGAGFGGGLWFSQPGTARRCLFVQNGASHGGGGAFVFFNSAVLEDCHFYGNQSFALGDGGGGIACDGNYAPTINRCIFVGNQATQGGGMNFSRGSLATITNCLFAGNIGLLGGGLSCEDSPTRPRISFCTLFGNTPNLRGGGVISLSSGMADLSACLFANHSLFDVAEHDTTSDSVTEGCLFFGNTHGVYFDEGSIPFGTVADAEAGIPEFTDNLEADPLFPAPLGGTWDLDPVFSETDFQTAFRDDCSNWTVNQFVGRSIVINPNTSQNLMFAVASNTHDTLHVWGDAESLAQSGDSYTVYDLSPVRESPAHDRAGPTGLVNDLYGAPRPVDIPGIGNDSSGDVFDIGAVEHQDAPIPTPTWAPGATCTPILTPTPRPTFINERTDINGDNRVDWFDLFLWQQDFMKTY